MKALLNYIIALESDNVSLLQNYLFKLNEVFVKIIDGLKENKIQLSTNQSEIEGKLFRYWLTNHSILKLSFGNEIKLDENLLKIGDISGLNSLTRLQIEIYAVLYYLIFDEVEEEELLIRSLTYKLHGLQKQYTLSTTDIKHLRMIKIKNEIDQITKQITESKKYKISNEKEKKKLLKPEKAIELGKIKIINNSPMSKYGFSELWSLYSNYAHNEYISDRQFNEIYITNKNYLPQIANSLHFHFILTASLIRQMIKQFPELEQQKNNLNAEQSEIIKLGLELTSLR